MPPLYRSLGTNSLDTNMAIGDGRPLVDAGVRLNDRNRILRVGFAGCGRIAQAHAAAINKIPGTMIVGVADPNPGSVGRMGLLAAKTYGTVAELVASSEIDVLHVLTPPAHHYESAKQALDLGVSVLVEKPVAFSVKEVADLYRRADQSDAWLCPDFNELYNPKFAEAVALVQSGQFGRVIHVEAHKLISLADLNSQSVRESQGVHWSYELPGGVLHNHISHPLYLVLYFAGTPAEIAVVTKSTGTLGHALTDHISVQFAGEKCSGSLLMSVTQRGGGSDVRIYCEDATIHVDFDTRVLLVSRRQSARITARAASTFSSAGSMVSQTAANAMKFARGQLRTHAGLNLLVKGFYQSLQQFSAPPISRELTLAVAKVEEAVMKAPGIYLLKRRAQTMRPSKVRHPERILLTGAAGYVGSNIARKLSEEGYLVRAMVRPMSRLDALRDLDIELAFGDIRCAADVESAANGMDVIVHCAAATQGSEGFLLDTAVNGTKNVAGAARAHRVKRVVYVSSMSIYDFAEIRNGGSITESSPLEDQPRSRGFYAQAKRQAEDVALAQLTNSDTAWTVLRPSVIIGHGRDICSPLGPKRGSMVLCFSSPKKRLRLIHVDDVSAAVMNVIGHESTKGQVFTVSQSPVRMREYANDCVKPSYLSKVRVIYVPFFAAWMLSRVSKLTRRLLHRGPDLNDGVLAYMYRDIGADSSKLEAATGWRPQIDVVRALRTEAMECRDEG
jgi:nucleoside-diphosphate-sugar epimerase/predicted dehydrogenase